MIRRIYVEKKKEHDVEGENLLSELKAALGLPRLAGARVISRYDIEGIGKETCERAKYTIFADPATDKAHDGELPGGMRAPMFVMEYLPGQYDQKADLAARNLKVLDPSAEPLVRFAKVIALTGDLSEDDITAIKGYLINPVDSREAELEKPYSLRAEADVPEDVEIIDNFIAYSDEELMAFKSRRGLAMSDDDIRLVQKYFAVDENRNPTITELRATDTYWSDHCRHSTFLTRLKNIGFDRGTEAVQEAFDEYMKMREEVYGGRAAEKNICLMDVACIGAKYLKMKGLIPDLDESDEVNACSVKIKADVDGKEEDWILMFKNETHNHPTEIEPFGGASTCLGGAIRDPLSGRVHVYQAMRVTGSGDPRRKVKDTLPGKLPQRKITLDAAEGYSSYGNQIGAASGQITEIYDEGYVAKRMELGALVGAAPAENVVRGKPVEGDVIILIGGRTGRDGCGGATGSSKGLTEESNIKSGAEVQKGDPHLERGIVRLFRRKDAAVLIKKCNDFGAGGVSVAVGELADSIDVNLDHVPVKYDGLDGTELAISESQERMAAVVSERDMDAFMEYAAEENLEATVIAKVTDTGRFRISWRGKVILNLKRDFLNTGGAPRETEATVKSFELAAPAKKGLRETFADLNCCSQKGLIERFDSTIGAATVLAPLGGSYQLTPAAGMAAKLPLLDGETNTATLMAYGFNPEISKASPFHGAVHAVMESVTKIAAMGGDISGIRLSFQEYFEKMKGPDSWGKPLAALLGALKVQRELQIPSLGGKDSMSGTFMDIDVPPTLVSFAICLCGADKVISPEFKKTGSRIVLVSAGEDESGLPDFKAYREAMGRISLLAGQGRVLAAGNIGPGGIFVSLVKMAAGNGIGFTIKQMEEERLVRPDCTGMILEIPEGENISELFSGVPHEELGATLSGGEIVVEGRLSMGLKEAVDMWTAPLEGVFPVKFARLQADEPETISFAKRTARTAKTVVVKPRVLIPIFPGTVCETDQKRAFEKAGAEVQQYVFRGLNQGVLMGSIDELAEKIKESQILLMTGGSLAAFQNEKIKEAVSELLENRDGLILGIGDGFQALVRLGLLPYGVFNDPGAKGPALTCNRVGRHVSRFVRTRVASVMSPWCQELFVGDIHTLPVSSGEGRFTASPEQIAELSENGQIAAQYVDLSGMASMDADFNPCGSEGAVEAITSPDGRILGKLAHSERAGDNLHKNVSGNQIQKIFDAGVKYFNY